MKVVQTISGDKSFVDFAITKDGREADIYSVSCSTINREDFKEKLDKYVTLTESNIEWKTIKTEKGDQKVDVELFQIISAFLTGSTRGRTDSTFENENAEPKRQRMDIILSIDTRLTDVDLQEYKDCQNLVNKIQEKEQQRNDKFDEWAKGWENMTQEEIDELNRKYQEEIEREAEQSIKDDPDYKPESEESDGSSSDSTTDSEQEFSDTKTETEAETGTKDDKN